MSDKKNHKVPKSDKTRLSDLTPEKDAPGGIAKPTPPVGLGSVADRGAPAPIKLPPPNP